jgi:hypothetical protein
MGDVVARLAVATGGCVGELTVAVEQGNGGTVDLGLDGDGDVGALEIFLETLVKFDQLLLRAGGMLSIGTGCWTCWKPAMAAPPTRRVGEFGSWNSGCFRSRASSSRKSRSYSESEISGEAWV